MDRRSKLTKSGVAATSLPTCNYYEQMLFLVEGGSSSSKTDNTVNSLVEEHQSIAEEPPSPQETCVFMEPTAKMQMLSSPDPSG